MAEAHPTADDHSTPVEPDADKTHLLTPGTNRSASQGLDDEGQKTEIVTSAPSAFDIEKTQIVAPRDTPQQPNAQQPTSARLGPQGPAAPPAPAAQPAARPAPPPASPPRPAAPGGYPGGAPGYGAAPAPQQTPHNPGSYPPPPPGYGQPTPPPTAPGHYGTPPPPLGYGQPGAGPGYGQPTPPPGYGPPPGNYSGAGGPGYGAPYSANGAQSPMEAANALLAKGNSFLDRLMSRGIRGELIKQPWFQAQRQHNADQFVLITYITGIVLTLILGLVPGVVGTILALGVGVAMCYVFLAVGTKRAHQFLAYGVCGVGFVLSVLGIIFGILALIDMTSMSYSSGTLYLSLIIGLVVTAIVGAACGYVGLQVHRAIQRMSAPPRQ